ncbi:MAG TPA: biotin-independent malonate decarboxylase subunit beta [Sulfuricaulis sp.]|nr:biotin-independent malonate decarboxylase subunit beta [Sulfuricaulis sp.]
MTSADNSSARRSYYEATGRQRIAALLDRDSFHEWIGPRERVTSPHLKLFDVPVSFDDGVIVGRGTLDGKRVFIVAQEGGFMGGSVGEVHGAKITGVLRRALIDRPHGVLLLLESGGVRLHEANAGLIAVSEILQALLALRAAGIPVVALIGGAYGCFGGMSIVAHCCNAIVISELGRIGLSGPEVIETVAGVEEFDSRDLALVWRTVGGKSRYLLGDASRLVPDDIPAFRAAASEALLLSRALDLENLERNHECLAVRLNFYGDCKDAEEIWSRMGIISSRQVALLDEAELVELAQSLPNRKVI